MKTIEDRFKELESELESTITTLQKETEKLQQLLKELPSFKFLIEEQIKYEHSESIHANYTDES